MKACHACFSRTPESGCPRLLMFQCSWCVWFPTQLPCSCAASRMESNGFPMCIHISKPTMELLAPYEEWLEFGSKEIKGSLLFHPQGARMIAPTNVNEKNFKTVCTSSGQHKSVITWKCAGKGVMTTYLAKLGNWEAAMASLQVIQIRSSCQIVLSSSLSTQLTYLRTRMN